MNKSKIKKVGQDVIMLESAALAKLSKNLDTKMSPKQIFDISTNQNFQKLI